MAARDKVEGRGTALVIVFDRRQTGLGEMRIAFAEEGTGPGPDKGVSKSDKSIPSHAVRAGRDAVSSVKFSQELTAAIDAWAEAHQTTRSDAIRQLVELGLSVAPLPGHRSAGDHDPLAIEALAERQLGALLDPSLPPDERERRIRRLVDGPPEFSTERLDLPKHQK